MQEKLTHENLPLDPTKGHPSGIFQIMMVETLSVLSLISGVLLFKSNLTSYYGTLKYYSREGPDYASLLIAGLLIAVGVGTIITVATRLFKRNFTLGKTFWKRAAITTAIIFIAISFYVLTLDGHKGYLISYLIR